MIMAQTWCEHVLSVFPLVAALRSGTKRIGRKAERGGLMQKPMFLRVLWVVSDEVSLYGLTALLDLVGSVSQYEVCLDVSAAESGSKSIRSTCAYFRWNGTTRRSASWPAAVDRSSC
ncbi:hypothetical protein LT493_10425 [Streptomyces tricolor]|nr:hypothetical protein [Streptomyces tricolor]